jgi:hypothetical protein
LAAIRRGASLALKIVSKLIFDVADENINPSRKSKTRSAGLFIGWYFNPCQGREL